MEKQLLFLIEQGKRNQEQNFHAAGKQSNDTSSRHTKPTQRTNRPLVPK